MKTIEFYGQTFEVDEIYKFIAMDDDGGIFVYEIDPPYDEGSYVNRGLCKFIGLGNPIRYKKEI